MMLLKEISLSILLEKVSQLGMLVTKKSSELHLTLNLNAVPKLTFGKKIMKDISLVRSAGPYKKIPFNNIIQSPVGLTPKGERDVWLIFHLSYPWGKNKISVNAYTPKELCFMKYKDFNRAVRLCLAAGKGFYAAKSDMQSAFRNLPIKKEDWK